MTYDPGREGFEQLSPVQQADIRRRGNAVGDQVAAHCVQVLIGRPANQRHGAAVDHAAGCVVLVGAWRYLATAAHVVDGFRKRVKAGEDVVFQAGNLLLNVEKQLAFHDQRIDVALLKLEEGETKSIAALTWIPDSWPPKLPSADEWVAYAGFPTAYRQDDGKDRVDLAVVGGMMRVTSASSERAITVLERESLIAIRGEEVPPPGTDLGGMSGGPVFRVGDNENLELVGVVTDYGDTFDTFFLGLFGHPDIAALSDQD
jgi:hypothetical protein